MLKRGQVTIFVIVAIVIVVAVLAFFFFQKESLFKKSLPPEVQTVHDHVVSCLDQTLRNVLFIKGLQGGYYEAPKNSYEYNFQELYLSAYIPYYRQDSSLFLPSLSALEEQVSIGIRRELPSCLNFTQFSSLDISSDFQALRAHSQISPSQVKVTIDLPVRVVSDDTTFLLSTFESSLQSRYSDFYSLAKLISEQQNYSQELCISCIQSASQKFALTTFTTDILEESSYVILYYIIDENTTEEPIRIYSFAHKFTLEAAS